MMQKMEKGEGLTSYDHLIMVAQGSEGSLHLCYIVDMGHAGLACAFQLHNDPEIVYTTVFNRFNDVEIKISQEEIRDMFQYVRDNPECFITKEKADGK